MTDKKCTHCEGLGIVADPHHGHAFTCSDCSGTGIEKSKPQSIARFASGLQLDDEDA